jgi:UDP-N-acetylglucosamine--N-acetylmuramyl-(pentapeptide) pyrophosphoryl-undecaprenol N-acetylglucosamine transferase
MAKVIISGGGTGGHIFPAVAIANELRAIEPSIEILFVGAEGKMEMEKVPKAGYQIVGLPIAGIKRELSLENLSFPIKLVKSLMKANRIVKDFKPDAAVGVGGYASGPTLMMAALRSVPILIQEQNSYAGITNKILSKWAKKICVAYPNMNRFFEASKITFTGNPVRKDILDISGKREKAIAHFSLDSSQKTILIIGGSQGARSINLAIEGDLTKFQNTDIQVVWQTGTGFFEQAKKATASLPNVKVYDFIYDMDLAYAAADVVVSRAGALSVSEICLVAKPSILVPFPAASEDHQTMNAMSLVNENAAILIKDNEAKEKLVSKAISLINDEKRCQELANGVKKIAKPNAGKEIAMAVLGLMK